MKKILFLSFITLMIACKKNDTAVSVKDTLIKHSWKSVGLVSNGNPQIEWCWLNSLYDYTADNKIISTQGINLAGCGDTVGTVYQYGYKLSADNKWIITVYGSTPANSSDSFKIISLNDDSLKTERVVNRNTIWESIWAEKFIAVP